MSPAERISAHQRGENLRQIVRLASGWVELAPFQFRRGYCLLLADPVVASLNDASEEVRLQFLTDMARVGDAVRTVTGAIRCNYSIYGNLDPFLHAHIVPRFSDEPIDERMVPPLSLPLSVREDSAVAFDPVADEELIRELRSILQSLKSQA